MEVETAAGGVVFHHQNNRIEYLIIKDRYGQWALPKGKTEPGEDDATTALREISEETGVEGEIVAELTRISYSYVHQQRGAVDKRVTYFLVRAQTHKLTPQPGEVSEAAWVSFEAAVDCCDYGNNLEVLRKAKALLESSAL